MTRVQLEFFPWGHCRAPGEFIMSGGGWSFMEQPVLVGLLNHPTRGCWLIDTGLHPRLLDQGLLTRAFVWLARLAIPFRGRWGGPFLGSYSGESSAPASVDLS